MTKTIKEMMADCQIVDDMEKACAAYLEVTNKENLKDFEEAYQGKFAHDVAFVREIADQTCDMDKQAEWPFYCIDWEYAARELMMDYSEQDGFYFRNL